MSRRKTTTAPVPAPQNTTPPPGARPVLVTTEYKLVMFGYAENTDGETIKLRRARCCLSWSSEVQGVFGLAAIGPNNECRVGPPVDIEVRKVTSVSEVSPEAVAKWEAAKWND